MAEDKKNTIFPTDLGWKEIVTNLDDGIVIRLTVGGLKKIIQDELES